MTGRERLYALELTRANRELADVLEHERHLRCRIESLIDALAPLRPTERVVDEIEAVREIHGGEDVGVEGHD